MQARPLNPVAVELHYAVAMSYARAGLAVIPCYPDGDRAPLVSGFTKERIPTERVHAIWNPGPHKYESNKYAGSYAGAAIGLVTGLSGLLVVDDDLYKKQPGGADTFERIAQANNDPLNAVPRVGTPKGGMHYYFRQPNGVTLGDRRGSLPEGTDVKGAGFVFAPGTYTAYGFYTPLAIEQILSAPPVPDWLLAMLQRPMAGETTAPRANGLFSRGRISEAIAALQISLQSGSLPPDCSYPQWHLILACIFQFTNGSEEGRMLAHEWSSKGSKYYERQGFRSGADLIDRYWERWQTDFRFSTKYSGEHTLALMVKRAQMAHLPRVNITFTTT